jgi:hypothetical protein
MNSNSSMTVAVSQPQEITTPAQTGEFYDKINNPMEAIKTMGEWIAHSGMFGCVKPEQGYVLAMECLASRQTPLSWKRENHLINGNITMKSESMLSGLMQAGWDIDWVRFDAEAAIADFRKGQKELRVSFSAEDAKQAGLLPAKAGSGWAKFPAEMLRARLISKATRMLDPRITQGRYTPEEVADFDRPSVPVAKTEPVNVTPAAPASDFTVVEKLEAALEAHAEKANAFLLSKNLIKEGQNFRDVSTKVANMILSDIPAFIAKIQ